MAHNYTIPVPASNSNVDHEDYIDFVCGYFEMIDLFDDWENRPVDDVSIRQKLIEVIELYPRFLALAAEKRTNEGQETVFELAGQMSALVTAIGRVVHLSF